MTLAKGEGWQILRHTCGTLLCTEHGLNRKQVSVWLGHSSVAFTISVCAHLLDDDLPVVEWDTPRVHRVSTQCSNQTTAASGSA